MTSSPSLWKVEGAGNDFILGIGAWADRMAEDAALASKLCSRRRGIGADGTLALHPDGPRRVALVYRNRDGGRARFCANGTRCAALAATRFLGLPEELVVLTDWTEVPTTVGPGGVSLDLPAPTTAPRSIELKAEGRRWRGLTITVGVPHLIVPANDVEHIDLAAVAPALRHHEDLGAQGANVSFVSTDGKGHLVIRTWERGVEAETLCCGSAVIAAAHIEHRRGMQSSIVCHPRSGDTLVVERLDDERLRLTGPARIVAEVRPDPHWIEGI